LESREDDEDYSTARLVGLALGLTAQLVTAEEKIRQAFAEATRFMIDNREGTLRPLTQLPRSSDKKLVNFAYQDLHTGSEASLYPPDDAVKNLFIMSAYVDQKLGSVSVSRVLDPSILDEPGIRGYRRAPK
jgi:hypothetical protein